MIRLDGPDLFQLHQECADQPTHTLKIAVLERPVDDADVDAWAAERLTGLGPMRWVLAGPRWARPVLVDGGPPDLARHVTHATLSEPGGEAELRAALAALCSGPLDRAEPLWHLTHLTGLADGRSALVFQVHHLLADGAASVALWEALADESAAPVASATPGAASTPHAQDALRSGAGDLVKLPGRVGRFVGASRRQFADGEHGPAQVFAGPMTSFNGPPEAARACAFVTLALSDLQSVRAASGATLTQVFLTVAGGAIRRLLVERGETLDAGLTATVPTALPDRRHAYGNAVTTLYVALHSEIEAPAARLQAVGASLGATRDATDVDPRILPDLQRYPRLYGGLVRSMEWVAARKGRPAYNLIVSSVRGPQPFSIMGVPVVELRSLGPLSGHLGLNLTGWSYGDDFVVGIHSTASAGADLDRLATLVTDELEALRREVSDG